MYKLRNVELYGCHVRSSRTNRNCMHVRVCLFYIVPRGSITINTDEKICFINNVVIIWYTQVVFFYRINSLFDMISLNYAKLIYKFIIQNWFKSLLNLTARIYAIALCQSQIWKLFNLFLKWTDHIFRKRLRCFMFYEILKRDDSAIHAFYEIMNAFSSGM